MFDEKHSELMQSARDNAIQVQNSSLSQITSNNQTNTVINNYYSTGVTESQVKEIVNEMLGKAEARWMNKFYELYQRNAINLNNRIIPEIDKMGLLGAFEDPGFLHTLYQAYNTASLLENEKDIDILASLLAKRVAHPQVDSKKIAVERAIEILNNVSDASLRGLAAYHTLLHVYPILGDISKSLDAYAKVFENLNIDNLPQGREWLEQLDLLGAASISAIGGELRPFDDFIIANFPGFAVRGIEENSSAYHEATHSLLEAQLPKEILIPHELHPGFVRLPLTNKDHLYNDKLILTVDDERALVLDLNEKKREIIKQVYRVTQSVDGVPIEESKLIKKNLSNAIDKREPLRKLRDWWNNINTAVRVNEIGFVLGYAYARQEVKDFPEWL